LACSFPQGRRHKSGRNEDSLLSCDQFPQVPADDLPEFVVINRVLTGIGDHDLAQGQWVSPRVVTLLIFIADPFDFLSLLRFHSKRLLA
jgi:hypothetical protein